MILSFFDRPFGGVSLSDFSFKFFVISNTNLTFTSEDNKALCKSLQSSFINSSLISDAPTIFFKAERKLSFRLSSMLFTFVIKKHLVFQMFPLFHPTVSQIY